MGIPIAPPQTNTPPFRVYHEVLDSDVIHRLEVDGPVLSDCPNYWVPKDYLFAPRTCFEQVVAALSPVVAPASGDWQGAEVWCQVYEHGRGLGFHFDKDEEIMKEEQRTETPLFSSVLFLTGDQHFPRQNPLVLTNQTPEDQDIDPTHSVLIFPRKNMYCVFSGDLAHGVLDSEMQPNEAIRMTLLINWWHTKPRGIHQITTEQIERLELSKPLGQHLTFNDTTAAPVANITVSKERLEDGLVLIDDILKAEHVGITGEGAMDVLSIYHPDGLQLAPVFGDIICEAAIIDPAVLV